MPPTTMRSFGTSERVGHKSSEFYSRNLFRPIAELSPSRKKWQAHRTSRKLPTTLTENTLNQAYCHSSEQMNELPDNSVHLMITSAPHSVSNGHDGNVLSELSLEYRDLLGRVFEETYRVLVPGGRACINVAIPPGREPYFPLKDVITLVMHDIGYFMRGEIIWNKLASTKPSRAWGSWCSPANPKLRGAHEYILVFCKGEYKRGAPDDGKATISKEDFLNSTKSVWEFPAESAKRVQHPAPFPVELPKRLIELYTYSSDIVLDPFMGSGSTAAAAIATSRRWIGYDTSTEYVKIANARVGSLLL